MDTTNLNISQATAADDKSEKTEKVKDTAEKASQLAGAAGLGVAGTMAVNAMNDHEEDQTEDGTTVLPVTPGTTTSGEVTAEAVTDFDPNDIMIEVDEVLPPDDNRIESVETTVETSHGDVALVEPQPITGTVEVEHTTEPLIAEVDPRVDDVMYGGPDGWEDFDHEDLLDDDTLLASTDEVSDDIDIADDLLA